MVSSRDVVRVEDLERHLAPGGDLLAAEDGAEAPLADLVLDEVAVVERAADQVLQRLRRGAQADRRRRDGGRARASAGAIDGRRETTDRRWGARRSRRGGVDGSRRSRPKGAARTTRGAASAGRDLDRGRRGRQRFRTASAAARWLIAVGVIGRPQAPQNRAPSSISVLAVWTTSHHAESRHGLRGG